MLALHFLNALAVILAWACARRISTYGPVAFTLAAGFAAELAREAPLVSLGSWLARPWARRRADLAVTAAALLVTGHLAAVVAGPYRFGLFGAEWYPMQLAYLMLFSILILLQGGAPWTWKQSAS